MKITLPSLLVAYDLFGLMSAVDPNLFRNMAGLNIQVPGGAIEAANGGAVVKIGQPNAGATAVDEDIVLVEGESQNFPTTGRNTISLVGRSAIATVDNCVLYVTALTA